MKEKNKLTLVEKSDLKKLITIVDSAKAASIEGGKALLTIRDRKLYREECGTFEEFCEKRWGYKRAQAYRLIDYVKAVEMSPIGDKIKNESQSRALQVVEPKDQPEVFAAAAAKPGGATAKNITAAAKEAAAAKPEPVLDSIGWKVPDAVLPIWNRRDEVLALMKQASELKCALESAINNEDPLYVELSNSVIGDLKMIRQAISYALPYAVCPKCNGRLQDNCILCNGRGVVSQERYKTFDEKQRDIREKAARTKWS